MTRDSIRTFPTARLRAGHWVVTSAGGALWAKRWHRPIGAVSVLACAFLLASCSSSPAPPHATSHGSSRPASHVKVGAGKTARPAPGPQSAVSLSSSVMSVVDSEVGIVDSYLSKAQASMAAASTSSSTSAQTGGIRVSAALGLSSGMSTAAAQGQLLSQLAKRQSQLSTLAAAVGSSASVTAPDRALLVAGISATASGLRAIAAKVQRAASTSQVIALAGDAVGSYRVMSLVTPKVYLTLAADQVVYVEGIFSKLAAQGSLEARAPKGVSKLSASVRQRAGVAAKRAEAETTMATTTTEGVSASVLSLIPTGFPGNKVVLQAAVNDLASVLHDLGIARNDLATLVRLLG